MAEIDKNYLLDSYYTEGTDMDSFVKQCKIMDNHTFTLNVDFTNDVEIAHFIQRLDGSVTFLKIHRDTITTKLSSKSSHDPFVGVNQDFFKIKLAKKLDNGTSVIDKETVDFINEMEKNGGTVYRLNTSSYNGTSYPVGLLFPGRTSNKTFKAMPVTYTHSSLERDLLLAKELQEVETSLIVTIRSNSKHGKIISYFSDRTGIDNTVTKERIPFMDVVEAVLDPKFGKGKCIKWVSSQEVTKLYYQFDDEVKEVNAKYPNLPCSPVHILYACDSGYYANHVKSAWLDEEFKEVDPCFFYNPNAKYKVSKKTTFVQCLEESMKKHMEDAEILLSDNKKVIKYKNPEEIGELFTLVSAQAPVGKKIIKKVQEYANDKYKDMQECTLYEAKALMLDCKKEGFFEDVSNSVSNILPEAIGGVIFNDKIPNFGTIVEK